MQLHGDKKLRRLVCVSMGVFALSMTPQLAIAQNPNQGTAPVSIVSPLPLPITGNVLTRNSDEPGRNPYQVTVFGECGGNFCDFVFPEPAQRIVLQHVNGGFFTEEGGMVLPELRIAESEQVVYVFRLKSVFQFTGSPAFSDVFVTNEPILAYVSPGQRLRLHVVFSTAPTFRGTVTLTGYTITE